MFKIRGHFIKQEPYFNNLMQLTFSTECGDLDIMVPQDDYQPILNRKWGLTGF